MAHGTVQHLGTGGVCMQPVQHMVTGGCMHSLLGALTSRLAVVLLVAWHGAATALALLALV